uniref:RING-type E3 ubiquitin transferase n=1 Tax=Cicer arietinum TaxID=3827 RepID=A0A1S2XDR3_CICAR|nr:putative RING-H2 finger protein ATL19 [Cicer arietinum]
MAEVTESSNKQFDGLMHMYVYVITFDLPTFAIVCIIITMLLFIFHQIFQGLFYWLIEMRPINIDHDIEQGTRDLAYNNDDGHVSRRRVTVFHAVVFSNFQAWTMVASIDEKRGQKLRASKKLPPLMSYGVGRNDDELRRSCNECAICLEDFQERQLCQVFPVCKHIFHSDCSDHWLQKKSTCPICRNCID